MKKLKVLIPVDGTEFSEAIFSKLVPFAKPDETEVLLLQVAELVPQPDLMAPDIVHERISPALAEGSVRNAVRHEMQSEAEMLAIMGYTVSTEVGFGDPAQQILFYADMAKIDLIAMATHGREGISRLLQGSVAESVLHHAKVPVLMVRSEH